MPFNSFHLAEPLLANIKRMQYDRPTPIQTAAIPVVMKGRDVIGLAQTGTGKTAAFMLPILNRLLTGPRSLRALVICPTRELADQIYANAVEYGRGTGIHGATIYGGVGLRPQVDALRRGLHLVVACPGRLLDHIRQRNVNLSAVDTLVLDEADHMFDMGFLPDIRAIVRALPKNRQTLLFSATMPDEIRKLAHEVLHDPVILELEHRAPLETVSHALYPVAQHLKLPLLMELLNRTGEGPVLVFTRTKHKAKRVAEKLEQSGVTAADIQGNLSQRQRQEALEGFKTGRYRVLVATDIAARGIDVSGISHVINFDIPQTPDAYTHRIGRTGRAAKTGDAYTLVTHEDEDTVRQIERMMKTKIERRTLDGFNYKADAPHRSAPGLDDRPRGGSRHPQQRRARPSHAGSSHAPARSQHTSRPAGAAPAASSAATPTAKTETKKPSFWRSFGKRR
jgi:ATP-dependent RNA helicase RhlE